MFEKLISILAPHYCMGCGTEGSVVCAWCLPDFVLPLPSRCYRCKVATDNSCVCQKCRKHVALKHVWVRTGYEDNAKQLIHDFKFERKQAAVEPIAHMMIEALPYLPPDTLVTHVPTATSRVRKRGYDQAQLIAQQLAVQYGLIYRPLLLRTTQTRQVRARRAERIKQMEDAFRITGAKQLASTSILLIDDLTTTGATLEAAARCLKSAGAKTINAAVFAQKQ